MGHPLGATGAMILGTVLDELERTRQIDRADHALHRRRHGHRDDHRAGVSNAATCRKDRRQSPRIDQCRRPRRHGIIRSDPFQQGGRSGRSRRKRLGNAAASTQFGVNLTTLKPGAASSLRHWHEQEDEFVYILEGEVVLIENDGETVLKPGDAAGFKAGSRNGH